MYNSFETHRPSVKCQHQHVYLLTSCDVTICQTHRPYCHTCIADIPIDWSLRDKAFKIDQYFQTCNFFNENIITNRHHWPISLDQALKKCVAAACG